MNLHIRILYAINKIDDHKRRNRARQALYRNASMEVMKELIEDLGTRIEKAQKLL